MNESLLKSLVICKYSRRCAVLQCSDRNKHERHIGVPRICLEHEEIGVFHNDIDVIYIYKQNKER